MSGFLDHASQIFEAATSASEYGSSALTILIHQQGQIHIINSEDGALDSLQAEYGCRSAFRVKRDAGHTRVEGRQGTQHCVFESQSARQTAVERLGLFRDQPAYSVVGTLALT